MNLMNPRCDPNFDGETRLRDCDKLMAGCVHTMGLELELSDDSGDGRDDGEFLRPPGPFPFPYFKATAMGGLIRPS